MRARAVARRGMRATRRDGRRRDDRHHLSHRARARGGSASSETNERVARSVDVRIIINVVSRVLFQRQEYTHFAVETTLAASRGVEPEGAARRREESTSSRARETCVSAAILVTNHFFRARLDLLLDHVGSLLDGGDLFRAFFVERDLDSSSSAIMISTVSRVGAQVDKLGVRGDGVEVVPSCSEMMDRTLPRVSSLCARAVHTNQKSVSAKASPNRPAVRARRPAAALSLVESSLSRRVASSHHAPPPR